MKKIALSVTIIFLSLAGIEGQSYNWARYGHEKVHHLSAEFSMEYGLTGTLRYSRYSLFFLPIIFQTDFTVPVGSDLMDDFRYRFGWQVQFLEVRDFRLTGKLHAVARRYENVYTRHYGFGGEFGITAGYYRSSWFVAAESGYDHTGITHIRHTPSFLEFYPDARDGWYQDLAGNIYYGMQAGISLRTIDLILRAGSTRNRRLESHLIPMYAGIGATFHF